MLPQAGGYYVYARRAFGDAAGFAVGWTDWLTYCAVLGYVSIGIGEFSAVLFPALAGVVRADRHRRRSLAFVALQWAGLRVSSRFQEWTTAIKFVAFLALVVACLALAPGRLGRRPPSRRRRDDARRRRRRAAVGRDHLRRLAERALFRRGGSRSGAQPAALDDRRRAAGHRRLPLVNVALLAVLPVPALAGSTLAGGRRRARDRAASAAARSSPCSRSCRCRRCSTRS